MATERISAGSSRQQHRRSPKKQFSDREISALLSSGDRNKSQQSHQPLPDVVKQSDDRLGEVQPSTYVTKENFECFQPRIEIETEDEGNKTYLKELYIKASFASFGNTMSARLKSANTPAGGVCSSSISGSSISSNKFATAL
eukprot:gene1450-1596_t